MAVVVDQIMARFLMRRIHHFIYKTNVDSFILVLGAFYKKLEDEFMKFSD